MEMLEKLYWEMIGYYAGQPAQIQHFVKVHSFARLIGLGEGIDPQTLFTLEALAYAHDIGIKAAIEKHGSAAGPLQEKEGEPLAEEMLLRLGFAPETARRVGFLVGKHHTFEGVDGPDWQILLEADMLVNLFEGKASAEKIKSAYEKVFATESGKRLCREMFGL